MVNEKGALHGKAMMRPQRQTFEGGTPIQILSAMATG